VSQSPGHRRGGRRQRLPQRQHGAGHRGGASPDLHSGAEAPAAQVGGQGGRAEGGLRQPATGPRHLRQAALKEARGVGRAVLCTLLQNWRDAAAASARARKCFEAPVDSRWGVQSKSDSAAEPGRRNAAGAPQPPGGAHFRDSVPPYRVENGRPASSADLACSTMQEPRNQISARPASPPPNFRGLRHGLLALCLAIPGMAQTAPAADQPAPSPAPPPTAWKVGPVDVSGMVNGYSAWASTTPPGTSVSCAASTTRLTRWS